MILEQINGPEELKALPPEDLKILAQEIRTFLIEKISHTGGHLASNLGVVELTIALFKTLNLPEDKVIWDVGHQSYTHKILSGRMAEFDELRQYGGLSGFPKRKESPYDSFDTGHSSTSISAGLGIALGRDIRGEDYRVVSVIGDGALTGGMAYEALNNAARMKKNFIIVLNDNKMSISENVGGMSRYLNGLRTGSQVVVYSRGQLAADGEKAQQALVYRVSDVRLSPVRQLEGVVERAEEDGGLVLHLCDGRVITVYGKQSGTQDELVAAKVCHEVGLDAGDVVRVSYTGELMETDTRQMKVQKIELRAAALDAETSVLGTVSQVSGSAITLEACDGRTLHFSQLAPGGEISSELKKGDTVRVYYTGWLGTPQDTADTSGAKVVRAVFAYN